MTVSQRQALLFYLGYYTGALDGLWGEKSKKSTIDFQRDFGGISVDGICGEQTEKAMKHAVAYGIEKKPDSTDINAETVWDEIKYFKKQEFACKMW